MLVVTSQDRRKRLDFQCINSDEYKSRRAGVFCTPGAGCSGRACPLKTVCMTDDGSTRALKTLSIHAARLRSRGSSRSSSKNSVARNLVINGSSAPASWNWL